MLLNVFETALMNNPARAALQRSLEVRWLRGLGASAEGARALEIGCGRGVGAELILREFRAKSVDAFDLDPSMVRLAKRRLAPYGDRARVWVGDVERIDAPDRDYDVVFDFGIIHHVPNWRAALSEVYRVLKPGGHFYAEEVLRAFIHNRLVRKLLDHPLEDRFTHEEFLAALGDAGFELRGDRSLWSSFGWYAAQRPLGA